MTTSLPICSFCKHMVDNVQMKCKAYPELIPDRIYFDGYDHREPYEGDNGIRFVLVKDEEDREDFKYFDKERTWRT